MPLVQKWKLRPVSLRKLGDGFSMACCDPSVDLCVTLSPGRGRNGERDSETNRWENKEGQGQT